MSNPSFQDIGSKVLDSSRPPKEVTEHHTTSAISKVENKLNSSKILSARLASVIDRLRRILDPKTIHGNPSNMTDDNSRPQEKQETVKDQGWASDVGMSAPSDNRSTEEPIVHVYPPTLYSQYPSPPHPVTQSPSVP